MAIGLGGFAAILNLLGMGAQLGSAGLRKIRQWRDPVEFQRQEALRNIGISPEQYAIRRRNLAQGLAALRAPQQVFAPGAAMMRPQADITAGLDPRLGGVAAQRPTGLAALLGNLAQSARSGYQADLARIGARRLPVRNPIGMTSGELSMRQEALKGRGAQYLQNAYKLLSDYANRNAMAEIEAGQTQMQQTDAEQRLQNFLQGIRQRQQAGIQEDYLGQQQFNLGQAQLGNILSNEQRQQALRRYQIGAQPTYGAQAPVQQGGI